MVLLALDKYTLQTNSFYFSSQFLGLLGHPHDVLIGEVLGDRTIVATVGHRLQDLDFEVRLGLNRLVMFVAVCIDE